MSSELFIAGAGLSGLIAARMLINRKPVVFDHQPTLPNNHAALLRFRSEVVATATNTPFTKVRVLKGVVGSRGPVQDAIAYSLKVTGKLHNRSILSLDPVDRWVAPEDLIGRLAGSTNPVLGRSIKEHLDSWDSYHGMKLKPIISTLPMGVLMDAMGWDGPRPEFRSKPGWTVRAKLDASLDSRMAATLYAPHDDRPWYRASITNSDLIIEGVGDHAAGTPASHMARSAACDFCIPPDCVHSAHLKESQYQKIEALRGVDLEYARRFIIAMTERHGIYSLGRFATWRPSVLLDDVVQDVRAIERLLDGDSGYSLRL